MEIIKAKIFSKDFFSFLLISINTYSFQFIGMLIFSLRRNTEVILAKLDDEVIGGLILADFPIDMFIFKNLFKKDVRDLSLQFIKSGYKNMTYVAIKKQYRGQGYGKEFFRKILEQSSLKSYFVPITPSLQGFYEKLGAKLCLTSEGVFLRIAKIVL